jgi:uncharacterized protein (TIGR02271 family)
MSPEHTRVTGEGGLKGVLLDPVPSDPDALVRVQLGERRIMEVPAGLLTRTAEGYSVPFGIEDISRMASDRVLVSGEGGLQGVLLDSVPSDPDAMVRVQLGERRVMELPAGLLTRTAEGYSVPFSVEDIDRMSSDPVRVSGAGGLEGVLLDPVPSDPDALVRVQIGDRRIMEVPAGLLTRTSDGYAVPFSRSEVEAMGGGNRVETPETVIPVVVEELDVSKRAIPTGGVRVHRRVVEHEEQIDMPLLAEHVDVKRVIVDREVDGPLPVRNDGNTIIVPLVEEVLVVGRRYRLREEVHITKTVREERHRETVIVRRQEADIENIR